MDTQVAAAHADDKRAALKQRIEAAEQHQADRSVGTVARGLADSATSFARQHPFTTVLGGLAVGAVVASLLPGPGRRVRKQATARGAVMAGTLADLAVTYGARLLDEAGKAARTGQDRLGDLGETIADSTRSLRRDGAGVAHDAGSLARDAGAKAARSFRQLRDRVAN